jgi:hypothetical protein
LFVLSSFAKGEGSASVFAIVLAVAVVVAFALVASVFAPSTSPELNASSACR